MNATLIRTIACIFALSLAAGETAYGQAAAPPAESDAPQAPPQPVFRTEEIDQMVAPIALYPDQLLAQVLMAATYPLEIVQAQRWVAEPGNAKLTGDQLAAALEPLTWDPSVKSLVPFPQILKMMSDKLDWTQRLGDAFLAQQADVMSSVQRLRKQAQDAGNLKSSEQQTVVTEKETVIIQPANPQVVYVPSYNPTAVYGTWPYPAYPPVYYPPPPAYYPYGSALASGLAFGAGVAIVGSLYGWGDCDWHGNDVNINASRYNTINTSNVRSGRATQLPANASTWRHDPSHRAGVAYRDPATRQAYQRRTAAPTAASRDFRGYDGSQRDGSQRTRAQGTNRASPGATADQRQPGQRQPGAAAAARSSAQRQQPAAFQGMGSGSEVRAQADRGRASRQSAAGSAPRA
ncbi:MAG TPA: DUF3300 domain-containing protein, partial [Stellaceae bacterium]|nr:DUF3300 domain-containing protein [Stellaceae bacterium]